MNKRRIVLSTVLAGSVLALSATGIANANDSRACGHGFNQQHNGYSHAGMFKHRGGGLRHMLHRLKLTEGQRDKIFEIRYAQKPALRAKMKEMRKHHQALRSATMGENYDAGRVQELAQAQGKSIGELIAMRAETMHRIYDVLTPEQRKQVDEWQQHRRGNGRMHH